MCTDRFLFAAADRDWLSALGAGGARAGGLALRGEYGLPAADWRQRWPRGGAACAALELRAARSAGAAADAAWFDWLRGLTAVETLVVVHRPGAAAPPDAADAAEAGDADGPERRLVVQWEQTRGGFGAREDAAAAGWVRRTLAWGRRAAGRRGELALVGTPDWLRARLREAAAVVGALDVLWPDDDDAGRWAATAAGLARAAVGAGAAWPPHLHLRRRSAADAWPERAAKRARLAAPVDATWAGAAAWRAALGDDALGARLRAAWDAGALALYP